MIRSQPTDDSGLIDLNALMEASRAAERAPARSEVTPVPVVRNLDLYPFGAPAPTEPAAAPAAQEKPRARRSAMRVVLPVLGGVALAGALAFVFLSGPGESTQPAAAGAVPAERAPAPDAVTLPLPPPVTTPAPAAEPTPAPTDSGSVKPPVATRPPAKTTPVKTTPVKATPVKTTPVKTTPVKTTPVKTPAPSPCNGDLRCEMERAVKGG